ncbi:MAG: cytochrome c, partial [Bdellovibrionales bacterium]|nr:cytochrome c [Bdellovibrionales bacterium]
DFICTLSRSPRVTPPTVPDLVIFRIVAGTGAGPWNRPENEVELFVGQTLRLINEDQMLHQLKTPSLPCESASTPMENEDFFDCKIQSAYSGAQQGETYDALYGPSARFFMSARDGKTIYDRNCLACHGGIASTSKRGRTADAIKYAISQVDEMRGFAQTLSEADLRAIAFSLK